MVGIYILKTQLLYDRTRLFDFQTNYRGTRLRTHDESFILFMKMYYYSIICMLQIIEWTQLQYKVPIIFYMLE